MAVWLLCGCPTLKGLREFDSGVVLAFLILIFLIYSKKVSGFDCCYLHFITIVEVGLKFNMEL